MISQLHDTGTLLFPLLGKGGFGGQYGNFDFATAHSFGELLDIYWHDGVATPAVLGVGIITLLAVLARAYKDRRNDVLFLLLPALLLANLALCIGTGGVGLNRYSYPAEASALAGALAFGLSALAPVLSRQRSSDATTHFWGLTLIAGLGACLALHVYFVEKYVAQAIRNVGMAALGPALRPAMLYSELEKNDHEAERQIRRLQAALPEGTALLERLDLPFLLDFRRNPIVIADWPGGASPWPGLPLFHGPESLATYLLSQNLRYVAYAYKNEALFPESDRDSILRDPWTQADAKAAWDFQRNLAALMQTRHLLYDDGTRAIIDLGAPGDSAPGSGNG
jgi:hypothetical protein